MKIQNHSFGFYSRDKLYDIDIAAIVVSNIYFFVWNTEIIGMMLFHFLGMKQDPVLQIINGDTYQAIEH